MKNNTMIFLLLLVCAAILQGCGSSGNVAKKAKTNIVADDYGYSEKNPIKVGGVANGPVNERKYLDRLTGPNGENITYVRLGSCCPFESRNGIMDMGMLDRYEITIEGKDEKKILYLNMYDKDKLFAPKGLLLKE